MNKNPEVIKTAQYVHGLFSKDDRKVVGVELVSYVCCTAKLHFEDGSSELINGLLAHEIIKKTSPLYGRP